MTATSLLSHRSFAVSFIVIPFIAPTDLRAKVQVNARRYRKSEGGSNALKVEFMYIENIFEGMASVSKEI